MPLERQDPRLSPSRPRKGSLLFSWFLKRKRTISRTVDSGAPKHNWGSSTPAYSYSALGWQLPTTFQPEPISAPRHSFGVLQGPWRQLLPRPRRDLSIIKRRDERRCNENCWAECTDGSWNRNVIDRVQQI